MPPLRTGAEGLAAVSVASSNNVVPRGVTSDAGDAGRGDVSATFAADAMSGAGSRAGLPQAGAHANVAHANVVQTASATVIDVVAATPVVAHWACTG
jgi:hypothetical protein